MIEPQRAISPRQLEERIAYLQVTLAALTAQLESQRQLDSTAAADGPSPLVADTPASPVETPLPIAAG
jgi:hypothetical protein